MAGNWQAPFRLLRDQFLDAAKRPYRVKLALAAFPDFDAYTAWYDRTIRRDLDRELSAAMNESPKRRTRASSLGTIWGLEKSVRQFETLAKEAGTCLPFDFHPAARLFPWFGELSNLNPAPVTVWSEFLFVTRQSQFRLSEDCPHWGVRVALLEANPFLASASAIEQHILAPGAPNIDGYFRLVRTYCPWLPNLTGGLPMTPPGILTPPDIRPELAEVFRRAVELEAALVARDGAGSGGGGGAEWVAGFLADVDADRAVHVAAERLLCGLNPRLVKVSDWSRQLDFMDATADARQALRTLGLAVADVRGEFSARGRELLAGGARHLWVGMTAGDREAARELLPVAATAWGWQGNPAGGPTMYDGPRATLGDPRVLDHRWQTRGPEYLGHFQTAVAGMNFLVDSIGLPGGGRFDIYRDDVKPSRASLPSVCPCAEPKPPEELRPPGELMADIDFRFRDLGLVGPDESVHWVGRQRRREEWCPCELAPAAFAGPRSPAWRNLRDLRAAITALTEQVRRYVGGARRGAVLRDTDLLTFDHLAVRACGLAQSLELPLPSTVAGAGVRYLGPTSLPVVERPDGLALSEGEIDRWLTTWRGVRVGVEARLARHDHELRPDAADEIDTRDTPLDAPAGTPLLLREAFEAVAHALFDTAVFRRETRGAGVEFRELAGTLAERVRAAERRYAEAELLLQVAVDARGCAHRAGLVAVRSVNDAIGHVMLGCVPEHMAASHVRQVPAPDVRGLLRRMREQVSRAATTAAVDERSTPRPTVARVRCDASDHSVYLDGKRLVGELHPVLFHFFRAIADHYPTPIPFSEIQQRAPGLRGKHQTRTKNRLPHVLARLVESDTSGYVLKLPVPK